MTIRGWERRLAEAQAIVNLKIMGVVVARIPYGKERVGWDTSVPCHDCNAGKHQFHVLGCDVEECPRCHTQMVSCFCIDDPDDDDEDEDDEGEDDEDEDDEDEEDEDEEDEDEDDEDEDDEDEDDEEDPDEDLPVVIERLRAQR